MDLVALKSEMQADPTGLGLSAPYASGAYSVVVDALNLVRQTINVDRETVPAWEVFEAMVATEWAALTAQEKQRVQTILSMGTVSVKGPNTRASFLAAFAGGTVTRTNLAALQTRKGSRAEQLWGAGTRVSAEQVAATRSV